MAIHYVDHIADVKNNVSCFDIARHYGLEPNRAGYICCPFHHEKTPSLKLYDDHFKCFGCGFSGDVITFVQRFNMVDFPEAMEIINRDFELGLPFEEKVSLRAMRNVNRAKAEQNAKNRTREQKAKRYEALLDLYAECERVIINHPEPDNKQTASAYWLRDWASHEIDNYEITGEQDDSFRRLRCG